MAIVKITCFIHNAFCFTASLPVNNFHFSQVKSTFQSVHWTAAVTVNQGRDAVILIILCSIVLFIPNTILLRAQAYTFHEFQRSRNQSLSSNPFNFTHTDEETTVIYFSFNHLWEKCLRRNTKIKYIAFFFFLFLSHDLKRNLKGKESISIL